MGQTTWGVILALALCASAAAAATLTLQVPVSDADLVVVQAHYNTDTAGVTSFYTQKVQGMLAAVVREDGAAGAAAPAALAPSPRPEPSMGVTVASSGLVGAALGLLWAGGVWALHTMGIFLVGYLLWEWRPLRRLLFGVARRLYRRSLED